MTQTSIGPLAWVNGSDAPEKSAINLGFRARVSQQFSLQGFYTYGNARGNVLVGADEFRLTDAGFQPDLKGGPKKDVSVNPLSPNCGACSGPLDTDAHHRVTIGATYLAPYGIGVSGVFRYRSALPFMIYSGKDLNGDGFRLDLPP